LAALEDCASQVFIAEINNIMKEEFILVFTLRALHTSSACLIAKGLGEAEKNDGRSRWNKVAHLVVAKKQKERETETGQE
jgi:hypothetical protein